MPDIFISYAREDEKRVRQIVGALEEKGWSIFWDRRIPPGKSWHTYIGKALSDARCVIVAWSNHSINSEWVMEEANDAKGRRVLVPVLLDPVQPPLGFRGIQAADLLEWKPGYSSSQFDQLIQAIIELIGTKPSALKFSPEKERISKAQETKSSSFADLIAGLKLPSEQERIPKPQETKSSSFADVLSVIPGAGLASEQERIPKPQEISPFPFTSGIFERLSREDKQVEVVNSRKFTNDLGMEFVLIPDGTFLMGSPSHDKRRSEDENQHEVTISKPFYLQTTQVTLGHWKRVMMNSQTSWSHESDECPVEKVLWEDAQAFISKLSIVALGKQYGHYRLPTEAEWEYACRSGSTTPFYFGDDETELEMYAWYERNSGKTTHPVGQKAPNAWGLYDMHGNVWEWCQDWYWAYPTGRATDPRGPTSGEKRVLRGGSWSSDVGRVRSAARYSFYPTGKNLIIPFGAGFRLAMDS
jgi:formylglycine-generating enzyme required for sulfatase activity